MALKFKKYVRKGEEFINEVAVEIGDPRRPGKSRQDTACGTPCFQKQGATRRIAPVDFPTAHAHQSGLCGRLENQP